MENNRLRADLKKLRDSMLSGTGEEDEDGVDQNKVLLDQYEALTDELERRREECIQLRTILANVSDSAGGAGLTGESLSTGEMPEAEELYSAYETQKNVIAQLQVNLCPYLNEFPPKRCKLHKSWLHFWRKNM